MNYKDIPLMFQAPVEGRAQIHRLIPKKYPQQAHIWVDEWIEGTAEEIPQFGIGVKTQEYQIIWRVVSNSGQDEGFIRPVFGARGYPYFPGSSMKGAFRRACTPKQVLEYCGSEVIENGRKCTKPGEKPLRFHGAYPIDSDWKKQPLVDLVHPQIDWQVKNSESHSAFIQISLYRPTLVFGISCSVELSDSAWQKIWEIWSKAMALGIGCRTSAGYGNFRIPGKESLLRIELEGRGLASQRLDRNKSGEFRPNMFKAALRGHTLRLFGGVTDADTAEELTQELWGGFASDRGSVAGLLGVNFDCFPDSIDELITNAYNTLPTYELTKGTLYLECLRQLSEKERNRLNLLVKWLIQFSLLFGGFGKSWRRVDHRLVYPSYLKNNSKPLIGCHWEFVNRSKGFYLSISELDDIKSFLKNLNSKILGWLRLKQKPVCPTPADWREAWHPNKVQIWGRLANDRSDSRAVYWFHGPYTGIQEIKNTQLTGGLGKIGRIWHRMYPRYQVGNNGKLQNTGGYVELLTIFPDTTDVSETTGQFLQFLHQTDFTRIW